jgi:hypothetical protein
MKTIDKTKSKLYKTTFINGDVHFGRVASYKKYTPLTYLRDKLSTIKSNAKNPNRSNMTTEFELRVQKEFETVKCEIIYEGLTKDCCDKKDEFIIKTRKCLNEKKSTINIMKNKIHSIKKEYVKKLVSNNTGETIYYVMWPWVKNHPYFSKHVVEAQHHPTNMSFKKLSLQKIVIK